MAKIIITDDYITTREYADLHGLPIETVRARVKRNQIPYIKVGDSIMIDRNTVWEERKKTGRIPNAVKQAAEKSRKSKLKVTIKKAYYVAVVDNSGKEVTSDFTFLSRSEAEKLGAKMKKEVEARGNE